VKLFSPDSAHWYQRDGVPLHTVLSAKGEPRRTTLGDARKLGLLPSVTNIIGVIAKPELTAWLQEQAVMAALTLPRQPGEREDAFAKRVVADSRTTRDGAADFGTAFHHGAERVARTLEVDQADALAPWLNHYRDWFQANCVRLLWTEQVLVNAALGYAGTADLLMEHQAYGLTLVDLKTQGVKAATGPSTYKSWGYQLAAYRSAFAMASASAPLPSSLHFDETSRRDGSARQAGVTGPPSLGFHLRAASAGQVGATGGKPVTCMNLILNSREAHPPVEAPWSEGHLEQSWAAFEAAHRLWVIEKGYDPSSEGGVRNAELPEAA